MFIQIRVRTVCKTGTTKVLQHAIMHTYVLYVYVYVHMYVELNVDFVSLHAW